MVKAGSNKYSYNLPPDLNFKLFLRILSPGVKNRNISYPVFTYRDPISFRAFYAKIS